MAQQAGNADQGTLTDRLIEIGRCHLPLATLVLIYIVVGLAVGRWTGLDLSADIDLLGLLNAAAVGAVVVAIVVGAFVVVYVATRLVFGLSAASRSGGTSDRSTWADYRRHLSLERLAGLFVVWTLLALLLTQFGAFKPAIPLLEPFSWDERLMDLDRRLHFGHHPWVLLQPLVGYPLVTYVIDGLYYLWFPISTLFFAWMGWRTCDETRSRFFLTYFALWILLGTAMATAFSSAGPVYYESVVGDPEPFGALVTYLASVAERYPLIAPGVHEMLWAGYTGRSAVPVEGIAAMPSIHVAVPILFAITGWHVDRWLGVAFAVYAAIILVGSVHLAWHYAVDGYVVLVLVPLLWWLSGFVARATGARSGSPSPPSMEN